MLLIILSKLLLLQNNKHKYDNYHKNNIIYNFVFNRQIMLDCCSISLRFAICTNLFALSNYNKYIRLIQSVLDLGQRGGWSERQTHTAYIGAIRRCKNVRLVMKK